MPEPEIARRCPTCGASIREVALFCPQCGNGLPPPKTGQSQTTIAVGAEGTTSKDTSPLNESKNEPKDVAPPQSLSDTLAIPKPDKAGRPATATRVRGAVGTKIQQATSLARGVEGDVMHRARRVRKISSVVLDEAGYDPSLRFVLVAVGLFILFLIIVLLNKVIT